jgi:hypothetical protein
MTHMTWVFLVGIGSRREVWGSMKFGYKRGYLVRGIQLNVYPRKGVIHVFQASSIVQEY